jgi:Bacterial dnaA protein helix-turn-helix
MHAQAQQPQVERRRAVWCPDASMTHGALTLPAPHLRPFAPPAFAPPPEPPLPDKSQALRMIIEQAVALGFDIEPELLSFPSRGRARTALARQVSMYVAHVSLSFSLTQVGQLFDRDRTTVAHACEVVEQRRDDVAFDRAIELLERVVRIMCGTPGRPNGVTRPIPGTAHAQVAR